jgi:hypothetical protein
MPGTDYLTEYDEPHEVAPYNNFPLMLGGELGMRYKKSWEKGKLKKLKNLGPDTLAEEHLGSPQWSRPGSRSGGRTWSGPAPINNKRKKVLDAIKSANRFRRLFGMAAAVQVGMGAANLAGSFAKSQRASETELESNRHNAFYEQNSYQDSRAAFTQRQRALQVIHNSRLSLKPALGSEASYLHQ